MAISWDQNELDEFFERIAEYDDTCASYSWERQKDGLRLLVSLFDLEGAVYASIYRDGVKEPVVTLVREGCTHAKVSNYRKSKRCLQVGSPEAPVFGQETEPILIRGIRIFVDPHFKVEMIDTEPRGGEPVERHRFTTQST